MFDQVKSGTPSGALGSWFQQCSSALSRQAGLFVDTEEWRTSTTLSEKMKAISWPRASIAGVALALLIGGGVWMMLQPASIQAHPPRLPTEQEWQATQAAEAFEGDLSPALAAANQSAPSEIP